MNILSWMLFPTKSISKKYICLCAYMDISHGVATVLLFYSKNLSSVHLLLPWSPRCCQFSGKRSIINTLENSKSFWEKIQVPQVMDWTHPHHLWDTNHLTTAGIFSLICGALKGSESWIYPTEENMFTVFLFVFAVLVHRKLVLVNYFKLKKIKNKKGTFLHDYCVCIQLFLKKSE